MVLRSGIIIPFQYRDTKKLLMIGESHENRDLSIWDLKNVVRAAFGIFNFEFRNKKIGFNIPDELLLHYLAQRHDLTNFVIEINQAQEEVHPKDFISFEPSCSVSTSLKQQQQQQQPPQQQQHDQEVHVPLPQKSNGSGSANDYATNNSNSNNNTPVAADATTPQPHSPTPTVRRERLGSPMEHTNHSDDLRDSAEESHKPRNMPVYSDHMPEALTQAIDPSAVIPKSELAEQHAREGRYQSRQQQMHIQQRHQALPQPQQLTSHHNMSAQQFFPNYTQLLSSTPNTPIPSGAPPSSQQSPYTPGMMNRFRIFDAQQQQDAYTIYPHCRCGAQKMRVDSPPPEPTNLCQQPNHTTSPPLPPPAPQTLPPTTLSEDEHECLQTMKLRLAQLHSNTQVAVAAAAVAAAAAEKASGSTATLDMPAANSTVYEACSPKMDCDVHDEMLSDSAHSPMSQHHHHHHHQPQQEQEDLQQQPEHERIQHEYMLQQQNQQMQQQHMEAMLQEQQQNINNNNNNNSNSSATATATSHLRQRKERMSKRQKDLYVTFLQQHPFINEHRRNDPVLDPYWLKLANLLNTVPQGAIKHVTEWKQTFDNWRYRVFLYARYNSKLKGDETLNPRNFKPLTRTDKYAYAIWICNPDTAPPDLDKMRNVFMNLEETQQE